MSVVDPFKPIVLTHPEAPSVALHVIPYGLTIHRLLLTERIADSSSPSSSSSDASTSSSPAGQLVLHDLIVGPEDPRDHWAKGRNFFGPLVGRFANRLPSGKSKFVDARRNKHEVKLPEWGGKGVCHHGGPEVLDEPATVPLGKVPQQPGPLDRCVWTPLSAGAAQLFSSEDVRGPQGSLAVFAVDSPSHSNGFPGNVLVEALVAVLPPPSNRRGGRDGANHLPADVPALGSSQGVVRVEYRARLLDADAADVTPLNLTHHWGFNLSASSPQPAARAELGRIDAHTLRIFSSTLRRLDLDRKGIATGKLLVAKKDSDPHRLDFAGPEGYGRQVDEPLPKGGFDHFYLFGPQPAQPSSPVALLRAASTGIALTFSTSESGVQFYSANGQPRSHAPAASSGGRRKALHDRDGDGGGNAERSAAFLEFSHPHAAFLRPELQKAAGGADTLLYAEGRYRNWCEVEVWSARGASSRGGPASRGGGATVAAKAMNAATQGLGVQSQASQGRSTTAVAKPTADATGYAVDGGDAAAAHAGSTPSANGAAAAPRAGAPGSIEGLRQRRTENHGTEDASRKVAGHLDDRETRSKRRLRHGQPGSWEIPRKIFHSSIGFLVLHLYHSKTDLREIVRNLSIFFGVVVTADVIRLNVPWFEEVYEMVLGMFMRESEKTRPNGVIWYLIGVITCLHFFPEDIACVSVMVLSWADTAASVFGRLFGRYTPKLPSPPFASRKSLAGSLAAAVAGGLTAFAFWGTRVAELGERASGRSWLGSGARSAGAAVFGTPGTHGWLRSGWTGFDWGFRARPTSAFVGVPPTVAAAREVLTPARGGGGSSGGAGTGMPLWLLCAGTGLVSALAESIDVAGTDDNLTIPIGVSVGLQTMLVAWGWLVS